MHRLARYRVSKAKLFGVKKLSFDSHFLSKRRIRAIHGVAKKWMPESREVHSDLVGATSFEIHLAQRKGRKKL